MRSWLQWLAALVPCAMPAQQPAPRTTLESLAAEATRLAPHFADRRVAATEGYRRLGADFPGMGEHWLQSGQLLLDRIDPARPTLLMYATIADTPTLLGVGFVTTTHGLTPATDVPGWPDAWHEHSGLLADESGVAPGGAGASDTHVWILHVWTTMPNPDGKFSPDNWSLPFAREGLEVSARPGADAGRALALLSAGDAYLRNVLTDARVRVPANEARVDAAIVASRSRVASLTSGARNAGGATVSDVDALGREWQSLARALREIIGPQVERYLAPPHPAAGTGHQHDAPRK